MRPTVPGGTGASCASAIRTSQPLTGVPTRTSSTSSGAPGSTVRTTSPGPSADRAKCSTASGAPTAGKVTARLASARPYTGNITFGARRAGASAARKSRHRSGAIGSAPLKMMRTADRSRFATLAGSCDLR